MIDLTASSDRSKRVRTRALRDISGITLHQTACRLGENPERWRTLAAHIGVTAGGQILLIHPLTEVVYHANALNSRDVGIEVEGNFEGVEGDPATFWRPAGHPDLVPSVLTPAQLTAAREAIRWVCAEADGVRFVHAHRQASATRRSDPGSRIWREVGLWACSEFGLTSGSTGFRIGDGRPIPEAWDHSCLGIRY